MNKSNSVMKSIISLIIIAFVTLGCFMVLPEFQGNYDDKVYAAEGEEEEIEFNYSLNQISNILSGYIDTAMRPNSENENNRPSGVKAFDDTNLSDFNTGSPNGFTAGDAGAFIGYKDNGWLSSLVTNASSDYKYAAFDDMVVNSSGNRDEQDRIMRYMQYGYVLSELGFDTTGDDGFLAVACGIIVGGPILLIYTISLGVPIMFQIIIMVLQFLNPFGFFEAKLKTILDSPDFTMGDDKASTHTTFTHGIASIIGDWYQLLYDFSWTWIVPISLVVLIVSALLFRETWSKTGRKKMKNYFIRILFLVAGIPICGSTYTVALNKMSEMVDGDNTAATRVIASTFVDFESWASNGRLSPAYGVHIEVEDNPISDARECNPSPLSLFNTRSSAYYINRAWSYGMNNLGSESPFGNSNDLTAEDEWNNIVSGDRSEASINSEWDAKLNAQKDEDDSLTNFNAIGHTMGILKSFMSAESFTASEYESEVKADLTRMAASNHPAYGFYINDLFEMSGKKAYYYAKGADGLEDVSDDEKWLRYIGAFRFRSMKDFFADSRISSKLEEHIKRGEDDKIKRQTSDDLMPNIFANGDLRFEDNRYKDNDEIYRDSNSSSDTGETWLVGNSDDDKKDRLTTEYGLSTMSMFNYLNTVFESNGVTSYSSDRSASLFTRDTHRSVSLIGTGLMSMLYWVNAFVLIGAFCVIGYCYSVCILFGNIKRSARLIASVPGAMLGSMKSIARVVAYTVIMILEVLATILAYYLVTELLMDLSGLIEAPFISAMTDSYVKVEMTSMPALTMATVNLNNGMTSTLLILAVLLSVILTVWFTITALRWRKKIVRTLDEAAVSIIDRLFDTQSGVNLNTGSKIKAAAGKAAGAVATGAGMALGNKFADNAMDAIGAKMAAASGGTSGGAGGSGADGGDGGIAMTGDGPDSPTGSADGAASLGLPDNNVIDAASGGSNGGGVSVSDDDNVSTDVEMWDASTGSWVSAGTAETADFSGDESQESARAEAQAGERAAAMDSIDGTVPDVTDNPVSNAAEGKANEAEGAMSEMGSDAVQGATESINDNFDTASDGEQAGVEAEPSQGGGQSVMNDMEEDDRAAELKKEKQKEALKNAATGGAQAAKGAAEAYVGVQTGNAQMAAQGAQDMQEGSQKMASAGNDMAKADSEAKAQAHAERQQKEAKQAQSGQNQGDKSNNNSVNNVSNNSSSTKTDGAKNSVTNGGSQTVKAQNSSTSNSSSSNSSVATNVNKGNNNQQTNVDKGRQGDLNETFANNVAGDNMSMRGGDVHQTSNTNVNAKRASGNGNSSPQRQSSNRPANKANGSGQQRQSANRPANSQSSGGSRRQSSGQTQQRPQSGQTSSRPRNSSSGTKSVNKSTSYNTTTNNTKVLNSNANNSGGFIGGGSAATGGNAAGTSAGTAASSSAAASGGASASAAAGSVPPVV